MGVSPKDRGGKGTALSQLLPWGPPCPFGLCITIPISQVRKPRLGQGDCRVQGHATSKWWRQDLNPGLPDSALCASGESPGPARCLILSGGMVFFGLFF